MKKRKYFYLIATAILLNSFTISAQTILNSTQKKIDDESLTIQKASWTYIGVGLEPAWSTEGVNLLRGMVNDDDMFGGVKIHSGQTGGTFLDQWSQIIDLPFSFKLFGMPFEQFCVNKSGLLTFDISVCSTDTVAFALPVNELANQDKISPSVNLGNDLPNANIPNYSIAYYWDDSTAYSVYGDIYYFVYGSAPNRQVWIINPAHQKKGQYSTHTALVLEETSNRFFVIDMNANDPDAEVGYLTVGAQLNSTRAQKMPSATKMRVVGESTSASDNAMYVFQPYQRYTKVSGNKYLSIGTAFDKEMADYLEQRNLPGALVAVSKNGRLIFSQGYGYANVEAGIEMQPWHRSGVGSVSKVLTAIGVMKVKELIEQSEVNIGNILQATSSNENSILDQPLYGDDGLFSTLNFDATINTGIINAQEKGVYDESHTMLWKLAYNSITPRHLLTHTAGFREAKNKTVSAAKHFNIPYEDITYAQVHRYVLKHKPLGSTPAGLDFSPLLPEPVMSYSNHSFGLSGLLIEALSGSTYVEFMQNNIFDPLDLDVTSTLVNYTELTNIDAKRYYYYKSDTSYHKSNFDDSRVYGGYGFKRSELGAAAGGWVISAQDLVRLLCATDQLSNQSDILLPDSLDEMESIPFPDVLYYQPLGWDAKNAQGRLRKNGKTGAMGAFMAKYPSGINVAIIFNTGSGVNLPTTLSNRLESQIRDLKILDDYDLFTNQPVLTNQNQRLGDNQLVATNKK